MGFFKNFIVAVVLVGILTRLALIFVFKDLKKTTAAYLSFFVVGIIIVPIVSFTLGFDVTVSEYFGALVIWLLFDLLRAGMK